MAAMIPLRDQVRSGLQELVSRLREAGTEVEVCRCVELEAILLRAEHAMIASLVRDDFDLGLASLGELSKLGRRLEQMLRVRVAEQEVDGEGSVRMLTVVELQGLRQPVTLRFHYSCAPDKKRRSWSVIYFVTVSYSHGPARKLIVLRAKARECFPAADGSDDKRVLISGARLQRLARVLRLGLSPEAVLQLLLSFDLFDEEWDVANTVLDAMEAEMEGGDDGADGEGAE
jgi:hypothetical protein